MSSPGPKVPTESRRMNREAAGSHVINCDDDAWFRYVSTKGKPSIRERGASWPRLDSSSTGAVFF